MSDNPETATYAITGGADKKIRYWDFTNLRKKSYVVNSPTDSEQVYIEEHMGDTLVIQEKAVQQKQIPQLNA